jgi:hypothetical protein
MVRAKAPLQPGITEEQKAERVINRLRADFHAGLPVFHPIPIPEDEIADYQEIIGQLYDSSQQLLPFLAKFYQLNMSEDATRAEDTTRAQVYQVSSYCEMVGYHA